MKLFSATMILAISRDAGDGEGQGGHVPPQVLGYQLTLFGPRGADYARHITTGPPHLFGRCGVSVQCRKICMSVKKEIFMKVRQAGPPN